MAYPISTMIGIRTGGVFAGDTVMDSLKGQIIDVIAKMEEDNISCGVSAKTLDGCISSELTAMKGSYVVIAGVFNYWDYAKTSEFGKRLSDKLGTEIMVMTWDEDLDTFQCGIFLAGKDLKDVNEDLVSRICRRTG